MRGRAEKSNEAWTSSSPPQSQMPSTNARRLWICGEDAAGGVGIIRIEMTAFLQPPRRRQRVPLRCLVWDNILAGEIRPNKRGEGKGGAEVLGGNLVQLRRINLVRQASSRVGVAATKTYTLFKISDSGKANYKGPFPSPMNRAAADQALLLVLWPALFQDECRRIERIPPISPHGHTDQLSQFRDLLPNVVTTGSALHQVPRRVPHQASLTP